MGVLGASENTAPGESGASDHRVGDHALDGKHHRLLRTLLHQLVITDFLESADPTAVTVILFLLQLAAGENRLFSIDNDDMIAAIV